ncbi:ArsR/SmtB family transcription factor [Caldalkalibacillus mannanilyticus]|uniref:ArsR/SmtB family transcription factor n=1 Tax=Caldalkalibacillus mannanilyticus TaxID=1418 RepID=UPI000B2AA2D0
MEFEKLADLLKALSDPTRLRIIALLQLRDFCVCELVPIFQISQPAVSKHMSRLKSVGLSQKLERQWFIIR